MSQQDMDQDVSPFDRLLRAVKDECASNGWEWPPPETSAVGVANTVLRVAARELERVEASRRDWAAEAEKLTEQLESRQELGDVLLHGYDTITLALSKRWGQEKTDKFLAQLQEAFPFRESGGVTVDESGVVELVGEPGVNAPCSCLTPEGAAFVAAQPKWSLPLCAVHPEVER